MRRAEKKVRDQPLDDRQRWVDEQDPLALSRRCELAGIARSTIYAPRRGAELGPDPEERALLDRIDANTHGVRSTAAVR